MRAPARDSAYYGGQPYDDGDFFPGERIGPPPKRRGGVLILRALVLLGIAGGGWWLLTNERETWPAWMQSAAAAMTSAYNQMAAAPTQRNLADPNKQAALAPIESDPPAARVAPEPLPPAAVLPPAPHVAPPPPVQPAARAETPPLTTGSLPPTAERPYEASREPLPPPHADPSDPYQVRAMAVGLHPRLSRALLERLSNEDYRNAGIAIKTALAETGDDGTLVWPRQRNAKLALFKVHFVPGAAAGCRRYVVTITKDRWSTTAFPMEKCGAPTRHSRRN